MLNRTQSAGLTARVGTVGIHRSTRACQCGDFASKNPQGIPEKVLKAIEQRVPLGRLARPEEIANTFAFLASDEASYINGAVIEVSGGLTL